MKWTKYYKDGTSVSSPASWRNTPLDNIEHIELEYADEPFSLKGPRYWQWNSYKYIPGSTAPSVVSASIAAEIADGKWQVITIDIDGKFKAYPATLEEIRKHGFVDGNVS